MDALLNSLTDRELALVRETGRDRFAAMDEDALADLHTRVRRAKDRYGTLYRREAASRGQASTLATGARRQARRDAL